MRMKRCSLAFIALGCLHASLGAAEAAPVCYRFSLPGSPENHPVETEHDRAEASQSSLWCYETVQKNGRTLQFAFSGEEGKVDPALAALTEFGDDGRILSVAHGSRLRGQVTFAKSEFVGFNPLSRPLDARSAAKAGSAVAQVLGVRSDQARAEILRSLEEAFFKPSGREKSKIVEGITEKRLTQGLPYRGSWYPYGDSSLRKQLEKYDKLVKRWTGTDPKSLAWEKERHSTSTVDWGGHCNGWAAASVLYPEYPGTRVDPDSRISFKPSDIKGLLAEASWCVDLAFFGIRYYGEEQVLSDIVPHRFHEVLLHYIGKLNKPVAYDQYPDEQVDNVVISGYRFDVKKVDRVPNAYRVKAAIRVHVADSEVTDELGVAQFSDRKFEYQLTTDVEGNIVGGSWAPGTKNPDFLWVPLAQKNCGRENPHVDPLMIERIVNLPVR